jgi:hypothetical protein
VTTKNIDWDKSKSLKLAKSMKTEKASIEKWRWNSPCCIQVDVRNMISSSCQEA